MMFSERMLRNKAKLSLVTDHAGEGGCGGPVRRTYVRFLLQNKAEMVLVTDPEECE